MIGQITFVDEELNQNKLNESELVQLQSTGKYKNLRFDYFFKSYKDSRFLKCFTFHLIYQRVNRYEIRLEDMFNLKLKDQKFSFFINVHQDNDFGVLGNLNWIPSLTNIDIKYRQWFYTLDLDIFKLIREYVYRDHKYHDMDRLLSRFSDFPNETTSLLPIYRPHFDYRINNSRFYEHWWRIPNCKLSKRIELAENVNIRWVLSIRRHSLRRHPII